MWWIISGLLVLVLIFWCFGALKVASDADDGEEKWWKDHESEFKKEDNNANKV